MPLSLLMINQNQSLVRIRVCILRYHKKEKLQSHLHSLVIAGLLLTTTAASANTLNFIGNRAPLQGAKSAITIQGEGTCSYHRQSPATFTIGGGQPQPLSVPGTFGHGTALPTPSSLADTNTVFGAFITVPLSVNSSKNCDEFYDVQRIRAKLKLARELHDAGQITDTEFSNISKEAYASLE